MCTVYVYVTEDITPAEGEEYNSDSEADHKNISSASGSDKHKLLKPIKTALKRVERSITQKREVSKPQVLGSHKAVK